MDNLLYLEPMGYSQWNPDAFVDYEGLSKLLSECSVDLQLGNCA